MDIIKFVCNETGISEEDFFSKKRNFEFVRARVICSIIFRGMGYKYNYIAPITKKHRTATYHYERLHKVLISSDRHYRETYEKITQKLKEDGII